MDRLDRIEAALEANTAALNHIDTTLDRLTERHEALAETVEILGRDIQELRGAVQIDAENIRTLAQIARDALASIQSLERTAASHQRRLDGHGERIQHLEDEK